jgi:hypothetical protein
MSDYHVLDLFAGLGGFSQAFANSPRWDVTTVELESEFNPDIQADVLELTPSDLPNPDVILAGHPCTLFSTAGNHGEWDMDAQEPTGERAQRHVTMLYHTLGLIRALSPAYWYLENPRRSRLRWVFRPPDEWVSYCQYGRDYQKDTGLWGNHAPMTFKKCAGSGGACHRRNVEHDGTAACAPMDRDHAERSKVPFQLSEAIRDACEAALDGDAPVQTTADEWVSP